MKRIVKEMVRKIQVLPKRCYAAYRSITRGNKYHTTSWNGRVILEGLLEQGNFTYELIVVITSCDRTNFNMERGSYT